MYISNRWNRNCYFSPAVQANARGVALFFCKKDTEGNYLILDLSLFNKRLTLATVYRPNKDDPKFYMDLFSNIQSFENYFHLICGNFNLVSDPGLE